MTTAKKPLYNTIMFEGSPRKTIGLIFTPVGADCAKPRRYKMFFEKHKFTYSDSNTRFEVQTTNEIETAFINLLDFISGKSISDFTFDYDVQTQKFNYAIFDYGGGRTCNLCFYKEAQNGLEIQLEQAFESLKNECKSLILS